MFTKAPKVKFQDHELDDYVLENSVLKSKLQSKIDALAIMSQELDKCGMERDRYRVVVQQLKCTKKAPYQSQENIDIYKFLPTSLSGGDLLANTREENNVLKLEVESLRGRLDETTGDIAALRKQLQQYDNCKCGVRCPMNGYSNKDYENLVLELEKIHTKYQQLQLDYRVTLDDREELCADREYYKGKVQRLNQQISYVLSNRNMGKADGDPPRPTIDLDSLMTENRDLHERLSQLQVEKEIVKRTLTKYKTLLGNRSKGDSLDLKKGFIDVMTQKQVRSYLDASRGGLQRASAPELHSLCRGLLEALNDKALALQHQRKTNRILANRITELEKTLESWCNGQKYIPIFPSQMLLEEFLPDTLSEPDDRQTVNDSPNSETDDVNTKSLDSHDDGKNSFNHSDSSENGYQNNELYDNGKNGHGYGNGKLGKTVLPLELQALVREALAEMKSAE